MPERQGTTASRVVSATQPPVQAEGSLPLQGAATAPVRLMTSDRKPDAVGDGEGGDLLTRTPTYAGPWPSPWNGPRMHGVELDADDPELDVFALGAPAAIPAHLPTERVLGVAAVAMISFFNVSGGPIGSEQTIAVAGPVVGLSALGVMWLCFAVPQALITAELSSAFPQNGGYSLWVETAFGRFWGIQESYWSWCSGVVDNALYPVLLYSTLSALVKGTWADGGDDASGEEEDLPDLWMCMGSPQCYRPYLVKLLITVIFTIPNVVSVNLVGQGLQAMCALVLAPFLLLSIMGLAKANPARWSETTADGTVDWTTLLSVLYWNVSGWDCASTFAGEVIAPGRTYPRGLALALVLMLLAYALPLFAASGCDAAGDWREWSDGSFAAIAQGIGGQWLGILIVASSALGNWGLFASELLEDSYQLLGMAEVGMAPRFFGRRHPRCHTPVNAILFQFCIIVVLIGFDFNTILTVDNFFSATQALLEFAACIKLRISRPDLERPFRVPLPTWGMMLLLVPPSVLSIAVALACVADSVGAATVNFVALLGGGMLYALVYHKCGCLPTFGRRKRHVSRAASASARATPAPTVADGLREHLLREEQTRGADGQPAAASDELNLRPLLIASVEVPRPPRG